MLFGKSQIGVAFLAAAAVVGAVQPVAGATAMPDLVPFQAWIISYTTSETLFLEIGNVGDAGTGAGFNVWVKICSSLGCNIHEEIHELPTTAMASGTSRILDLDATHLTPGTYTVTVYVDSDGEISESVESNKVDTYTVTSVT